MLLVVTAFVGCAEQKASNYCLKNERLVKRFLKRLVYYSWVQQDVARHLEAIPALRRIFREFVEVNHRGMTLPAPEILAIY